MKSINGHRNSTFISVISKVVAAIMLASIVLFHAQPAFAQPAENAAQETAADEPAIDAVAAVLMESQRGQILYSKNHKKRLHISAACKIMTSIVAIEKAALDEKVTISKESVEAEGSALSLVVGQKYSVEDLLYGIMLTSANDAAKAIAEYVGGDIDKFVAMMNETAGRLNLKDTKFKNPTGLYDEEQYTTAHDVALLIKYAINNPVFNRIFSTRIKPWVEPGGEIKVLTNQNKLFLSYDGIDGGKIGYNDKDRQTLLATATRNNQRLISVVLDSPEKSLYSDTEKLLDHGFNNFRTTLLVSKGDPQTSITVGDQVINLVSLNDVYYTHPFGDSYIESIQFDVSKDITPPIQKNKIIGTAKFILKDGTTIDVNLYPDTEVVVPDDFWTTVKKNIDENRDIMVLVAFLLAIEVILLIYNIIRLITKLIRKIFRIGSR